MHLYIHTRLKGRDAHVIVANTRFWLHVFMFVRMQAYTVTTFCNPCNPMRSYTFKQFVRFGSTKLGSPTDPFLGHRSGATILRCSSRSLALYALRFAMLLVTRASALHYTLRYQTTCNRSESPPPALFLGVVVDSWSNHPSLLFPWRCMLVA